MRHASHAEHDEINLPRPLVVLPLLLVDVGCIRHTNVGSSVVRQEYLYPWLGQHFHQISHLSCFKPRIGGLVVKLAVAILHRTVSASPGFDSRPMHFCCCTGRRECRDCGGVE